LTIIILRSAAIRFYDKGVPDILSRMIGYAVRMAAVDRCCPFSILKTGKISFAEIMCFINRIVCGEGCICGKYDL